MLYIKIHHIDQFTQTYKRNTPSPEITAISLRSKSEMEYYTYAYAYGSKSENSKKRVSWRERWDQAPSWTTAARSNSNNNYLDMKAVGEGETKRKKRVKKYKSYETERKIKNAIKRRFKWLKKKIGELIHRDKWLILIFMRWSMMMNDDWWRRRREATHRNHNSGVSILLLMFWGWFDLMIVLDVDNIEIWECVQIPLNFGWIMNDSVF